MFYEGAKFKAQGARNKAQGSTVWLVIQFFLKFVSKNLSLLVLCTLCLVQYIFAQ